MGQPAHAHCVMPGREIVVAERYRPGMHSENPLKKDMLDNRADAGACPMRIATQTDEHEDAVSALREMFLALFEEANDAIDEILGAGRLETTAAGLVIKVDPQPNDQTGQPASSFEYACRDRASITIASMVHGQVEHAHGIFARDRLTRELTNWVRAVLNRPPSPQTATPDEAQPQ